MLKVLFVIDSLANGGGERSLINLLGSFDYDRYSINLQLLSGNTLFAPLLPPQVRVLPLPAYLRYGRYSLPRLFAQGKLGFALTRMMASSSLRVNYITQGLHTDQVLWRAIENSLEKDQTHYDVAIAYGQGMPTYYVDNKVHADRKLAWVNCLYSSSRYKGQFDRIRYHRYHNIILVSEHSRRDFASVYPELADKLSVVYDIIDAQNIAASAACGDTFTDNYTGTRIVTIGRMEHVKGIDLAIESCRLLLDGGHNVKWYLIGGGGSLQAALAQRIKALRLEEHFILLGAKVNPYRLLADCDIYVQPSRVESYCMALAEARLLCRPIVATDFELVAEHIRDGENGLTARKDPQDIAARITRLILDQSLRAHLVHTLECEQTDSLSEVMKVYQLLGNTPQRV